MNTLPALYTLSMNAWLFCKLTQQLNEKNYRIGIVYYTLRRVGYETILK